MSSKLYDVKRRVASILESDENLRSIMGGGPILAGWPNRLAGECSLVREMRIIEGTIEDWR